MRIVILHDAVAPNAPPEDLDNLIQAESVADALRALGHESVPLAFSAGAPEELERAAAALRQPPPDAVFNLVETVGGSAREAHRAPGLLAALGLAFTGSAAKALRLSTNKIEARRILVAAGLPVAPEPAFEAPGGQSGPLILKSVWEHASLGLDAASVAEFPDPESLEAALAERRERFGGLWYAEAYLPGREFNVAVLAARRGLRSLAPAEMVFGESFADRPKVLDQRAKWDEASPEYRDSTRRFDFPEAEAPLLARLGELSLAVCAAFGITGYARVDFRLDTAGEPRVIDVNANPCLSPDAGFAAALDRAGITYVQAIQRILQDALDKGTRR